MKVIAAFHPVRRKPDLCLRHARVWHDLLRLRICSSEYGTAMHWLWLFRWAGMPV